MSVRVLKVRTIASRPPDRSKYDSEDPGEKWCRSGAGTSRTLEHILGSTVGRDICGGLFTVEVVTIRGLCRYHVFFVLDLATRKVQIVGMARNPSGVWVKSVFRRLTDEVDGFLRNSRYLILDRDPLYTADARKVLKWSGVKVVRLPSYSPNLHAYAERFVGSVRRECLDRVIPLGEWHLRRLLSDYEKHYNHERNHQSLENRLIEPLIAANGIGPVRRDSRAGGLLSFYTSQAA